MLLDARKLRILQAVIDDYILTASPVGSRTISKRSDIGLSSATIRNEMSDLEELGYLEQPHTSAGRVPSDKAYRLYVDNIMRRAKLSDEEQRQIRKYYSKKIDDVEEIIKQTAWVLSSITNYTSIVLPPQMASVRLKYIHLVPIGEGKALAIIVSDAGITRESIIRIPLGVSQSELERLSKLLTARFSDCTLDSVTDDKLNELANEMGEQRSFLDAVVHSLSENIDGHKKGVELAGATNILNFPEYSDMEKARSLLSVMENKDLLYKMLTEAMKVEFSVTIGGENAEDSIKDCSVVTATYRLGDGATGSFGVIGPTRMDYSKVIAMLSYVGKSMSEVLTNMFEEERT